jgi:hypothetical protein
MAVVTLDAFESASDDLLQARTLTQQRIDRKYLLSEASLPPLLAALRADYRVVRTAGRAVARYHTLYFDTPDRRMYHDHRRGRRPRYKVRVRHHLDRRCSFLEVKSKGTNDRTTKARMELPFLQVELNAEARLFVDTHCPIQAAALGPCLAVRFLRVTLLSVSCVERVTLDWHLAFRHQNRSIQLPGVVIAEIKQARYSNVHGASRIFRDLGVREERLSKYGFGTACLAAVRANAFKPVLRTLTRLAPCDNC